MTFKYKLIQNPYNSDDYTTIGVADNGVTTIATVDGDATIGHLFDYWEGQDIDPDSNLHHITKAIASLYVLRDAQMRDMCEDDRPPKSDVEGDTTRLQGVVNTLFKKYPNPEKAYVEGDTKLRKDRV